MSQYDRCLVCKMSSEGDKCGSMFYTRVYATAWQPILEEQFHADLLQMGLFHVIKINSTVPPGGEVM